MEIVILINRIDSIESCLILRIVRLIFREAGIIPKVYWP